VKGRDWYDFSWYVRKGIILDLDHFNARAMQANPDIERPFTAEAFLEAVRQKICATDIAAAKEEVLPFLRGGIAQASVNDWSQEYFLIQSEHIRFAG